MKKQHSQLFKTLLNAYYSDNFEGTVEDLINKEEVSREDLAACISSLCGVNIPLSSNYSNDLKEAIKSYDKNHKVVEKIRKCTMDCKHNDDETPACVASCPFHAIMIDNDNQCTYIVNEKCTDCGLCVEGCPTGSILDKVEFLPLIDLLKGPEIVIAAVAPAITHQFGEDANIDRLRTAFKKMGFTDMIEVAFFADMLTLQEAIEFDAHVLKESDFMITSCCCPMWVAMLRRVYGDLVSHMSPTVSPMIAAGRVLKKLNPSVKVVFIGPCIAKKSEVKEPDLLGDIDYVLTFSELKEIFEALDITPNNLEETPSLEYASRGGRLYARTGGVSIAITECIERMFPVKFKNITAIQGNGVKECKELLSKIQQGFIEGNFIEGMGCVGGCVGGPKAILPREEGKQHVDEVAENSEIKVAYDSEVMNRILDKLGIFTIEDYKDPDKNKIFHREF